MIHSIQIGQLGTAEIVLLIASALMLLGILLGKLGTRFGVPGLLVFLATGLVFGSSGVGLDYGDAPKVEFFGTIALAIILFSGGLDTKMSEVRPVLLQGGILSTLGVLLTTVIFGAFLYWMGGLEMFGLDMTFPTALLLAATMSSTDSASVFALLRSHNMHLKEGLKPMLEVESGSNDPMAYMLTIALIQYVTGGAEGSWVNILITFLLQFAVGGGLGYAFGRLTSLFLNKVNIDNSTLYPITLLCVVGLAFSLTVLFQGNGYLAVYIMGIVLGNRKVVHKKSIVSFFDGFTWLMQIALFILLGLFVDAQSLLKVAPFALMAGLFMIFVARPLSVHICLIPFRNMSLKAKNFVSWVGLRGAVPLIFATYLIKHHVQDAGILFTIVFFITLLSLLIQGSTLPIVARWLKLDEEVAEQVSLFGVEIPQHTGTQMEERVVSASMLLEGNKLMQLDLKEEELVILVRRGENYMVPKGKLELEVDDVLLIVSEEGAEQSKPFTANPTVPLCKGSKCTL